MRTDLPPDQILIEDLTFVGRHGVFAHERRDGCRFSVDVVLHVDTRRAAESDRLADTLDYGKAAELVIQVGTGESCHLLEALADRICQALFGRFDVAQVDITLRKLAPPLDGRPSAVGLRLSRIRP